MKKQPRIHAGDVEIAVAMLLNYRVYDIVPNVHWGLGLRHECDMLAHKDGKLTEIEIKVTAQDLKNDFKKQHGHRSQLISRLYYAIPLHIWEKHGHIIPKECGVITVEPYKPYGGDTVLWKAKYQRIVKHRKGATEIKPSTLIKLLSLGCMRIWSLKRHNYKKQRYERTSIIPDGPS